MSFSTSSSDHGPGRPSALTRESVSYLHWYVALAVLLTLALGLFNWSVDPLQLYRRAAYQPVFSENQRYQNPGLAKNYEYETVIIGTSHAENFLPSHVERALGERAVKLAISGSTAYEQRLILEKAIETGRVRRVIWVLDHIAFTKPVRAVSTREGDFPFHLYHEGLRTLGLYLLSLDSLDLSLDALLGRGHRNLDTLNAWYADWEFGEGRVMADWYRRGVLLDRINLDPDRNFGPTDRMSRRSIRANLMELVRDHPEIRFELIFPPYSILSYLADFRSWSGAFAERQAYKAFLVSSVAGSPNVRVFDFQAVKRVTHDLRNYKDLEHYSLEISDWIIEAVATGQHRVSHASYVEVLARQAEQVRAYRSEVCTTRGPRRVLCPRVVGRAQP